MNDFAMDSHFLTLYLAKLLIHVASNVIFLVRKQGVRLPFTTTPQDTDKESSAVGNREWML